MTELYKKLKQKLKKKLNKNPIKINRNQACMKKARHHTRSTIKAMPCPTPMHMVQSA
jgi:hypothetical protein